MNSRIVSNKKQIKKISITSDCLFTDWFSTLSYFFSKFIVDSIPIVINCILYSIAICYYSQQIGQHFRFFYCCLIFTICILCSQSFGTIVGLILQGNQQLAVMTSMASYIVLTFFNNFIIPTKELVWIFQLFSDFTFPKHLFNSILIIFYGLDRCQSPIQSRVLYEYGITDNDLRFSLIFSIMILIFFKFFEFTLLAIITNWPQIKMNMVNVSKINKVKFKPSQSVLSLNIIRMSDCISNEEELIGSQASNTTPNGYNEEKPLLRHKLMIAWIDLTFGLKTKTNQKVILQNLNGFVEFQTITAIMGPSGAGKTTLLKCLNGENNCGLSVETKNFLSKLKKIKPCFINQNISEHLVIGLTVSQTLIYASKLKNSEISHKIDHKLKAKELMEELLITDIRDTNTRDCSGGELKRVLIASELMAVNKPNMLCIDEPTSGLDSNAAQVVSLKLAIIQIINYYLINNSNEY